ncbi:MAG: hypothetical protein AAF310_00340 [Myxococcota bacterium]
MVGQYMIILCVWGLALAYVLQHLIASYTKSPCGSCSHKRAATQQHSHRSVSLGASLQRGLQLVHQHAKSSPHC